MEEPGLEFSLMTPFARTIWSWYTIASLTLVAWPCVSRFVEILIVLLGRGQDRRERFFAVSRAFLRVPEAKADFIFTDWE